MLNFNKNVFEYSELEELTNEESIEIYAGAESFGYRVGELAGNIYNEFKGMYALSVAMCTSAYWE